MKAGEEVVTVASAGKVGRNDPCPCGSGKKYKQCCEQKAHALSPMAWIAIVGVAVAALAAIILSFTTTTELTNITCPPGQMWSVEHGHCH
ncbi:MAG: hypothetical protein CL477_02630 [Acidobacteria bacterium]|nr:hypothetical protein [Acidobacteriota bacterium]